MAKWHYNPETGDTGRCRAVYKCRYQLSEEEYYASAQEASRAYEERQSASSFPTVSKLPDYPRVSEPRIAAEKRSNSYHYQELWLRDENGNPAAYVKMNYGEAGASYQMVPMATSLEWLSATSRLAPTSGVRPSSSPLLSIPFFAYNRTMNATSLRFSHAGPDGGLHFWLIADGAAVSYAKIYESTTAAGTVVSLCDIETREGHRHRGYARKLLEMIAEGYGVSRVIHGGSYTPDGFSYVSQLVEREGAPAVGPSCGPMNFVHDWDSFQPKYA